MLGALGRFEEASPFLAHSPSPTSRELFWNKIWDPWRDDPRFTQLISKRGHTAEYKVARETLARMLKEREAKK